MSEKEKNLMLIEMLNDLRQLKDSLNEMKQRKSQTKWKLVLYNPFKR